MTAQRLHDRVEFYDYAPQTASFLEDLLAGLSRPQKAIAAKYFYDDRGSQLFEAICELPEYYPTRTETALMQRSAPEMARLFGPRSSLIEYGSGASTKTRLLLAAAAPALYLPIDISGNQLRDSALALVRDFPALHVVAVCADYSKTLRLPDCAKYAAQRRVVYFPGSTIGNFDGDETVSFLREAREVVGAGGAMLVGVDMKKNPAVLHAAYNDAQGITAEFNLNVLARANRELDARFDLDAFRHHAFYDADKGRIEMHLVATRRTRTQVAGRSFEFAAGETIHTEISCKYSVAEFQTLARRSGWQPQQVWQDEQALFSVHYLAAD